MSDKILSKSSEWTFELIEKYDNEISRIAHDIYDLDTYPNQIEIISAEQMLDAYSSVGMPLRYHHWSFGKNFVTSEKKYKRGQIGLAYELVINSNPCISYLMEENSMAMQALVLAHACYGHNSFFKNNYLFQTWTHADSIVDYLVFSKNYISFCEDHYGIQAVEETLDACHALMNYGVDRYQHPPKLSLQEEKNRIEKHEKYIQSQINELWKTIPINDTNNKNCENHHFPSEPQENILYFLEKNAPLLETWQREIIRIVRKIAQYFYPQRQTKVMNEGWATFWHYTILNQLYNEKLVTDELMMECLQNHTAVIHQPNFDDPHYSGINPYKLGFAIFNDIRRICENPTEEDKKWFPDIANSDWIKTLDFAMRYYKDESFIAQFLSPNLIRELKLFSVIDDDTKDMLKIGAIHNESGYRHIRTQLAAQYNISNTDPNIQVYDVDLRGDRTFTLRHVEYNRQPLNKDTQKVLSYLEQLWGFRVKLESIDQNNNVHNIIYGSPQETRSKTSVKQAES